MMPALTRSRSPGLPQESTVKRRNTQAERLLSEQGLPADPAVAGGRGEVYYYLERYDEALAAYDEAARLLHAQGEVQLPDLDYRRALVYWDKGDRQRAVELVWQARQGFLDLGEPVPRHVEGFIAEHHLRKPENRTG